MYQKIILFFCCNILLKLHNITFFSARVFLLHILYTRMYHYFCRKMLVKMLVCAKIVMQSCNCYSCTLYLEKWKNFDLKKKT